jgi:hypothetical protein
MAGKDDYLIQRDRIETLVAESWPTAVVHWDPDRVPTWIRFSVHSGSVVLLVSSGDHHVSEIADKTDDELRVLLKAWSGGKI